MTENRKLNTENAIEHEQHTELRRDVTVWGSYMWGFADVGADVCVALGLVMGAAQGATNVAFAIAGLIYILIGLAYTELSSTYPVAGGGQFFAMRGIGDFWGTVSGAALLLDYTIDIALFSVGAAGYLNFFFPAWRNFVVDIGPFHNVNAIWCVESLVIIVLLIFLNIKGIKESSFFNEILGVMDIVIEASIIIFGFIFAWHPELLLNQWHTQWPTTQNFMYGCSLAIISFVGLESISQAAQETRRPATIVPRSSLCLIFTVFIFAVSFSTLGLGMYPPNWNADSANPVQPWQYLKAREGDPVAALAELLPVIGAFAGPITAILGLTVLLTSANSGVMSASRVTYCMSQFNCIPKWFEKVHPKFHTPVRTIVVFSLVAVVQTVFAFFHGRETAIGILGNLYAFGATLGYTLVFISLIRLRFTDPHIPRPYKMPINIKIKHKGNIVEFPVLGLIGMLGVATILYEVILTHEIGRIFGPLWVILCVTLYLIYRKTHGFPLFGSIKRDWVKFQTVVLKSAEEYDFLEEYKQALYQQELKYKNAQRGDKAI